MVLFSAVAAGSSSSDSSSRSLSDEFMPPARRNTREYFCFHFHQSINQSINRTTSRSSNQSINQSISGLINCMAWCYWTLYLVSNQRHCRHHPAWISPIRIKIEWLASVVIHACTVHLTDSCHYQNLASSVTPRHFPEYPQHAVLKSAGNKWQTIYWFNHCTLERGTRKTYSAKVVLQQKQKQWRCQLGRNLGWCLLNAWWL